MNSASNALRPATVPPVDVVIPTCGRPAALAATLTSVALQRFSRFRVIVSDQTEGADPLEANEVRSAVRVLRLHDHEVELYKHLPRRGIAEHRDFLLQRVKGELMLAVDDDVILMPDVLARLVAVLREEGCGFVGNAVIGPSFVDDVRPHEQAIELWQGRVEPEVVLPGSAAWLRYRLHNGANLLHVQRRLWREGDAPLRYRVAWVGGCVLYDVEKLRACGGFGFWQELPPAHCGEDVLAQLRVMARYGGCGVIPSGAFHQELPTTIPAREVNAPEILFKTS